MQQTEGWESLRLPAEPQPPAPLTVRRFVILTSSCAAGAFVWHRTGGDPLLSTAAVPFAYGALSTWLAH